MTEDFVSVAEPLSQDELSLGILLNDQFLFSLFFQAGDLSIYPTPPQRLMFLDQSDRILLCTSRFVAKTVSLIGRLLRFMATHIPQYSDKIDEVLIFAPSEAQLNPLIEKWYAHITREPSFRSLVRKMTSGDKATLDTKNNTKFFSRIDGTSGDDRNMVGIHPIMIVGDECAFTIEATHRSRIAGSNPQTKWIYAGVPNNVRGVFWKLDTTDEGDDWSRHKMSVLKANPLFLKDEKYQRRIIKSFGGKGSYEYITQIDGEWGDNAVSSFPPGSISWKYSNEHPYWNITLTDREIDMGINTGQGLPIIIGIPSVRCDRAIIGWDWGYSPDPSTFMVAFQNVGHPWYTHCCIQLFQVNVNRQVEILRHIVTHIINNKLSMLSVDNGPVFQMLHSEENAPMFDGRSKMTNAGGAVWIDVNTGELVTDENKNRADIVQHSKEGKVISERRKYWLTENLRRMMLNAKLDGDDPKLWLGYDQILENEFTVTTEVRSPSGNIVYQVQKLEGGRGGKRVAPDQIVDSLRALVDCIMEVDAFMFEGPDYNDLLSELGWSGRGEWKAPWESNS